MAEWAPGKWFAIARDNAHRDALLQHYAQAGSRQVSVWTIAEVAVLIRSIPLVSEIKDMFPGAEILPPRLPPVGKVPRDEIPFGAWGVGERHPELAE